MAVESLHYCLYFTLAIGYKWHHWVVIEIQEAKVTKIPQNESYFCKELYNISTNIFAHCFLVCHHFQQFMAFPLWEPVSMLQLFFFRKVFSYNLKNHLMKTFKKTLWKTTTTERNFRWSFRFWSIRRCQVETHLRPSKISTTEVF